MLELEPVKWKKYGPNPIIGVDEVGRGCLAGPVYAGAVILKNDSLRDILTDSKLISEKRRPEISNLIKQQHFYGIGTASVEEIDEINILQASLLAMKRAVEDVWKQAQKELGLPPWKDRNLSAKGPGILMIDGKFKIPDVRIAQETFIKGDLRVSPISAAAIVAKVERDQFMLDLGKEFPAYDFQKHKGYATALHKKAIAKNGPTEWHRKSFAGVKEYCL
jgi:ribonuclease HII